MKDAILKENLTATVWYFMDVNQMDSILIAHDA